MFVWFAAIIYPAVTFITFSAANRHEVCISTSQFVCKKTIDDFKINCFPDFGISYKFELR